MSLSQCPSFNPYGEQSQFSFFCNPPANPGRMLPTEFVHPVGHLGAGAGFPNLQAQAHIPSSLPPPPGMPYPALVSMPTFEKAFDKAFDKAFEQSFSKAFGDAFGHAFGKAFGEAFSQSFIPVLRQQPYQ